MFKTLACNSIKFASRKTPCCSFATSYKVGTPIPVNIMKGQVYVWLYFCSKCFRLLFMISLFLNPDVLYSYVFIV